MTPKMKTILFLNFLLATQGLSKAIPASFLVEKEVEVDVEEPNHQTLNSEHEKALVLEEAKEEVVVPTHLVTEEQRY